MKALAAVAIALAIAAPASAAWRRVDSPNFIVVGDASVRTLQATAQKFEAFREVLRRVMPAVTSSSPVPTVVIVFATEEAFTPFKPVYQGKPKQVGAYVVPGVDVSYIAMMNAGEYTDRAIFHEYTHMVVANAVARIPLWLNEGLADFYSTFALTDGGKRAKIGLPVAEYLHLLNGSVPVPLIDLLKADSSSRLYNEDNRISDFYAESWALTHMLLNGQPSRVKELSAYLQQVNNGADERQVWDQVFGTARTENDFRRYVIRPTFGYGIVDFPEKLDAAPIAEKPLTPADATAFLAGLLMRLDVNAAAKLLTPALAQSPGSALAAVTMAQIDLARHDPSGATKRIMPLDAIGDWFAEYGAATALVRSAGVGLTTDDQPAVVARAATLLKDVRRSQPELPNVLALQARVELLGDAPPASAALEDIARARALAPGRVDYALTQAELYATAHDFVHARAVVGPLMTSVYPEEVRAAARRLMGGLVTIERELNGVPTAPSGSSRAVAVPDANEGAPPSASASRVQPAYRALQTGERRLEGTLERIDCPAGQPALFRVRTTADVVELEARLGDVQFITFRDDLTGGVSCGPRVPMRVYATWREGSSPRHEKVVVAVEFLPKD